MVQHCFPCHGVSGWHGRRLNEVGWRRVVNRMFAKDGRVANMAVGVPQVPYGRVSEQQKEEIIEYLTATFGPGSKARDLKTDPLVRDEQALSTALYVQYDLKRSVADRKFANGQAPSLGGHSAHASLANPGVVYISGNSSNSILRVDTRDPNYDTRTKEFWIDNPGNVNTTPHGIVEVNGKIWFTELAGDRISTLDPNTGQFQRYRIPTEGGGPHSLWNDSKGNFWFTYFAAAGKIGRFDSKTQQVREYDFPDFSGYGLVVDKQDRAWAVGLNTPVVLRLRPSGRQVDHLQDHVARAPGRDRFEGNGLGVRVLRQPDRDDRSGLRQGDRVRSAAQMGKPVRPLARRGRQHLGRERGLQLPGEVRPADDAVDLRAVPRPRRPYAEARSRQGRHVVVYPRRVAKRAGRVQAQGQRPVRERVNGSPIDTPRGRGPRWSAPFNS